MSHTWDCEGFKCGETCIYASLHPVLLLCGKRQLWRCLYVSQSLLLPIIFLIDSTPQYLHQVMKESVVTFRRRSFHGNVDFNIVFFFVQNWNSVVIIISGAPDVACIIRSIHFLGRLFGKAHSGGGRCTPVGTPSTNSILLTRRRTCPTRHAMQQSFHVWCKCAMVLLVFIQQNTGINWYGVHSAEKATAYLFALLSPCYRTCILLLQCFRFSIICSVVWLHELCHTLNHVLLLRT